MSIERNMTSHASGPSGSRKSVQFAYDSQGRRYSKVVSNWTGSAWTRALHEKYLYDGWNLLGALDGTNNAIIRSFLWGLDLSGSLQGAGGVGGLLFFTQHSTSPPSTHCSAYDGNGNVMALVDGKTGSTSARYEYDPFGQTIRASGTMATLNPVRFSSKSVDDETDLAYYGYRYLNVNTGRWLNRDPIEEEGGHNLFVFLRNNSANEVDPLGLNGYVIEQEGPNVVYQDRQTWTSDIGLFGNGNMYVFGFGGNANIAVSAQTSWGGLLIRNRTVTIVVEVDFSCTADGNVLASSGRVYRRDPRFGFPLNPAATSSSFEVEDTPAFSRATINTLQANGRSPRASVSFGSSSMITDDLGTHASLSNRGSIVFKCVCIGL